MTWEEVSKHYHIELEKLRFYEESGLLERQDKDDGVLDCQGFDPRRVGLIHSLLEAGMEIGDVRRLLLMMEDGRETKEEQILLLRKCRCQLLEEIHGRQQALDQLDFTIRQIKHSD